MVPLASATALGVLGGVIGLSLLCLWWLLRVEAQESDEDEAIEVAEAKAARAAAEDELRPR
jgi:uncharacterized membrane protein